MGTQVRAGFDARARGGLAAGLLFLFCAAWVTFPRGVSGEQKFEFLPQFRPGQTFVYTSTASVKRRTKTESAVVSQAGAVESQNQITTTVRVTIRDVKFESGRQVVTAHAELESPPAEPATPDTAGKTAPPEPTASNIKSKIDFTVGGDGQVLRADGLDDLPAEQRMVWQYWVSQFAYGATLPAKGVSPGEKWKTDEVERMPAPIAGLVWDRETTYVQNDACPIVPAQQCAVFLTKATLKQKSSEEDATPTDYMLHHLKTSGTAKGINETIVYISLTSHLVMRAKEEASQSMDATIAKEDLTNQVRYLIETNSQMETVFVPATAAAGSGH